MGIAAPVIVSEMADWVALGGGNSGIVGDAAHSFGFHVAANELPATDYSRVRDPNGPNGPFVDWSYACAGDFDHRNDEHLRAMHRDVLARLMAGQMPMVCEFIGQPWADRPVYYWARWNGNSTLQRYTGQGHDHWSHISWYRSRVDQRANLWIPPVGPVPQPEREKMIITIVPAPNAPDGTKRWLMCNGILCHTIDETNLSHARGLHNFGAIVLWNGGAAWNGGWVPAFGVKVETLASPITPEQLGQLTAAASAGAEAGSISTGDVQGAMRIELDRTQFNGQLSETPTP